VVTASAFSALPVDMGQAGQHVDEHHADASGDHIGQRRRRTFVRNVQQVEAGKAREGGARHDRRDEPLA